MPSPTAPTITRATGSAPAAVERQRLPLAVYVLAAGTFLMGTTEFMVAGLLSELAADFSMTEARAGLTVTVFAVGMVVGTPAMALLTLRLPRGLTLMLSLVMFAAAHVLSAMTDDFGVLLLARFVAAIATGAFWAVAAVVAARVAGAHRSSAAIGVVLGGGMLANVLGVPLGSVAGQVSGWRGPFWVLAALALVATLAVRRLVPDDPHAVPSSLRSELHSVRTLAVWFPLAACAAVSAGVMSVYSFISPVLTGRAGLPVSFVPLALVMFGIGALVGTVVCGRLGDRRPITTIGGTAALSLVASLLLYLVGDRAVPALLAFALLGLVGLAANPVLVALVTRPGGAGRTLPSAMATSMFNLGTATGTAITGHLMGTSLGTSAPPVVGIAFGTALFVPLAAMRMQSAARRPSPSDAMATQESSVPADA